MSINCEVCGTLLDDATQKYDAEMRALLALADALAEAADAASLGWSPPGAITNSLHQRLLRDLDAAILAYREARSERS